MTRRDAVRALSAGCALGFASALRGAPGNVVFPDGAVIRTLLADLAPSALESGATLFHEHLSQVASAPVAHDASADDLSRMIEQVRSAREAGIVCIVDGGHADMGRRVADLRRIATVTGMHVVGSGGYFRQNTYPPEIARMSVDQIADDLVTEAQRDRLGAFGEIGQSSDVPRPTPEERKMFRAIGKAHQRTNLPVFTHNGYGNGVVPRASGLRQLDALEAAGVAPEHIAIGHMCCLDDHAVEISRKIAKRGAFVGIDRVTGGFVPDEKKIALLLALLDSGYADRILLSSDFTGMKSTPPKGYQRPSSLSNTLTVFVPKLRSAGVADQTLKLITVDNPRRFLAFMPK
jgi:phosphotriesterase-related protein